MALKDFQVIISKSYSELAPVDIFVSELEALRYGTAYNGGFRDCRLTAKLSMDQALPYMRRGNLPGRHFYHLEVRENETLRWAGRIMEPTLRWSRDDLALDLLALGYHSSLRDQRITTVDYSAGSHTVDSIIKAMLTAKCPDISSDQSNIAAVAGAVNLELEADKYTQDHIASLLGLGDNTGGTYYFGIWEQRVPWLVQRSVDAVDWQVPISSIEQGQISQAAHYLRNKADAYDGTTRTSSASDADTQERYPVRGIVVSVPEGTTAGRAADARDRYISEHKDPQQDSSFAINGPVRQRDAFGAAQGQRSAMRAGDVVQINGLGDEASLSLALDNLGTHYIIATEYDAFTDTVVITPDRNVSALASLLARLGVEANVAR